MRGRMTIAFALALFALMALVSAALIWYSRYAEERNADSILRLSANAIREESEDEPSRRDLSKFIRQEGEEMRAAGVILSTSPQVEPRNSAASNEMRIEQRADLRALRVKIGATTMTLGLPWRHTEERLRAQAAALILLMLFGTAAGTAGAWFLVGRTLSPIERLSKEADNTPIDALRAHLDAPSTDAEILHLVGTLNGLLDRLSQAAAAQSRFYSAASHELRPPLHTLSGHLEVGLSRRRSNEEYREAMEEAYRQTTRLSSLVQDLLLLTRLNTAPVSTVSEPVDLAEICERILSQFAAEIEGRCLRIETRYTEASEIAAPPNHAEMIVRNLLENAVKYTSERGAVSIALDAAPEGVRLEVRNDCAPLQNTEVGRLLEPFHRPDASRHSETGGNGLGLAICSAIAKSNRWKLDLPAEPKGFRIVVIFSQPARTVEPVARIAATLLQ